MNLISTVTINGKYVMIKYNISLNYFNYHYYNIANSLIGGRSINYFELAYNIIFKRINYKVLY